jgi:hypothetical protein
MQIFLNDFVIKWLTSTHAGRWKIVISNICMAVQIFRLSHQNCADIPQL